MHSHQIQRDRKITRLRSVRERVRVDKKIRDSFYENAMKNSSTLKERTVLTHSDIIQSRVTTDQDLKAYLMNIQQRNLPKGGNTGFIYDGESSEFRRPGK